MSPDPQRQDALHQFVARNLGEGHFDLAPASADASFRSYWRVTRGGASWVVMDAPPTLEDSRPWLDIGARLAHAGLHTPAVFAQDLDQGFLLLEDFGNRMLLPELNAASVDAHYAQALDVLITMQRDVDAGDLPPFDGAWATQEMELMPTWFLQRHLGLDASCGDWDEIELAFSRILDALAQQPQRFMHRDFHSRNLMIVAQNNPGIIDFQGARLGPITYDAVSLLRDCYIEWPAQRVAEWAEGFRQRWIKAGIGSVDSARFRRWFDFTGLQRHIKVLGIFCRLHYRDGKPQYLGDLPLVLRYVMDVARGYDEFAGFIALLERATAGVDITQPRA